MCIARHAALVSVIQRQARILSPSRGLNIRIASPKKSRRPLAGPQFYLVRLERGCVLQGREALTAVFYASPGVDLCKPCRASAHGRRIIRQKYRVGFAANRCTTAAWRLAHSARKKLKDTIPGMPQLDNMMLASERAPAQVIPCKHASPPWQLLARGRLLRDMPPSFH